jgi:hypothetical protein
VARDKITGFGKYVFADSSSFEGQLLEGRFDGDGTFTFPNNCVYFGEFKAHLRHGEGTMLDDTGVEIFSGRWDKDKPANKDVQPLVMKLPTQFIALQDSPN